MRKAVGDSRRGFMLGGRRALCVAPYREKAVSLLLIWTVSA